MNHDVLKSLIFVGGVVMINGKANVIKADTTVINGAVHTIDTVLMPPTNHWSQEALQMFDRPSIYYH